jgi:polar amino acid transport system substrate-binding protein
MTPDLALVRAELAPRGTLRVALNHANFLLVQANETTGEVDGVAPDLGREIAARLGVAAEFVHYRDAGRMADAVEDAAWDVGFMGAEPARAGRIAFTDGYVEIEAGYLVPAGSPLLRVADVDRDGIRIAVAARSAYDLFLSRTLRHARLVRADSIQASFELFAAGGLDALASLKPRLFDDARQLPGSRVLNGPLHRRAAGHRDAEGTHGRRPVPAALRRAGQSVRPDRRADRAARHRGRLGPGLRWRSNALASFRSYLSRACARGLHSTLVEDL